MKFSLANEQDRIHRIYCISKENVLFYHNQVNSQFDKFWKPVIPQGLIDVIYEVHCILRHIGSTRLYETLKRDVLCDLWQKGKHPHEYLQGEHQSILPTSPMQVVSVDLFGPLPRSN
ncbi:hypothetical protein PR048_018228 [Dryococelus australis]|uniref:Integrase zinc-binding domain-containing protein n=1 Tax=Dryococelus australis TaxID=614101 RepID=A0ABQ9HBP3_9NEOP|nr:hypothetical protein PR048_018228 [Dryococelus australis]